MRNTYDAIIIGAGHNGLVTAAYLAKAGLKVLVLERRDTVGGAVATEEVFPGFKFDPCAQGVGWLHPKVIRDLKLGRHGLEILKSNPTVFTPLPDGDHLLLWRETKKTARGLRRFSKADADRWGPFCTRLARLAGFLQAVYSITPPRIKAMDSGEMLALAWLGGRLRAPLVLPGWGGKKDMVELMRTVPMPVAEFLDDWFETDALKGTLGAAGITGLFQGPRAVGTAYMFLHHHVGGEKGAIRAAGLVRGGMGNLARALAAAAQQYRAEIRTGAEVAQIIVKDGRAIRVTLASGEEIVGRRIVSNADPRKTFLDLVDPLHLGPGFLRQVRNIKFRGGCAKVNLALGELPKFAGPPDDNRHLSGVISISPSLDYLERAYDDAKYGQPSRKPYLEVRIPSLTDPTLAPPGRHVMTIFVQYAPYHLSDGPWDSTRREALGDAVVETLAEYAPNIKGAILHRQVLTPLDLEESYGLTEGNIYHGELTLDQLFFMRPVPGWAQYRTPIENLYLCGAGTHPGGGVTGAPGYNAAREILDDAKRDR